jgi:hypothetical protein
MKQHVTVAGALNIGLGALGLLIACLVFVILIWVGQVADDADAARILDFVAVVVSAFLVVISLPGIVGGLGLLQGREWARILVLILSVLNLFNIPIGTAIGAYSIWVLMQQETVELFNKRD